MILGGMVALAGKITGICSDGKIGNLLILGAFLLNGILLFPGGRWIKTSKKYFPLLKHS